MRKKLTIVALATLFNVNEQTNNQRTNGTNTGFGIVRNNASSRDAALKNNTNTQYGNDVLNNNSGHFNSGFGHSALQDNTTGGSNTASGYQALHQNTMGNHNTASGYRALGSNATGNHNTASGYKALLLNVLGDGNTALGYQALNNIIDGDGNTALGHGAETSNPDTDNRITHNQTVIGFNATGQADHSVTLGNENVTAVYMGEDSGAFVHTAGLHSDAGSVLTLLGSDAIFENDVTVNGDVTVTSDVRLKANIVSLGATLAKLLRIDGKTYTLKKDGKQKIGLLAQDVEKVFPELVRKNDNEMLSVNYQGLIPVLINAMKEQSDKLKEQKNKISRLECLVEKLIAR